MCNKSKRIIRFLMSIAAAAATDRRRNAGPENSTRPLLEPSLAATKEGEILDSNTVRRDGRYPEQVRPIGTPIRAVAIPWPLIPLPSHAHSHENGHCQ